MRWEPACPKPAIAQWYLSPSSGSFGRLHDYWESGRQCSALLLGIELAAFSETPEIVAFAMSGCGATQYFGSWPKRISPCRFSQHSNVRLGKKRTLDHLVHIGE